MSNVREPQLEIARVLFGLPEARQYALAGGLGLVALGAVDRQTRDIDAFVAARPVFECCYATPDSAWP